MIDLKTTKLKWRSGPPPSIGWWPASFARVTGVYRWWDGRRWSDGANAHTPAYRAAQAARRPARPESQKYIVWLPRPAHWPERSKT
jgi:hypothetical protein